VATEYAECPDCASDGPHTDNEDGTLECGNCYIEFENPFYEADETERDIITEEITP
jgi:hypothetical protein